MSLIVAGRFQTFERAEQAAHHLIDDDGFPKDDVNLFYVNPPGQHATLPAGGDVYADRSMQPAHKSTGVGIAAGVIVGFGVGYGAMQILELNWLAPLIAMAIGAYLGSLIGAMSQAKPAHEDAPLPAGGGLTQEPVRESGVMLAVHVTEDSEVQAERTLWSEGANDVERASGEWRQGKWVDFNPVSAPVTVH